MQNAGLERQKEKVRDDFDRKAARWARLYDAPRDFRAYNFQTRLKTVVELLKETDGPILDVGCGTGDFLPHALDRSRNVIGVEVAESMARTCRERFHQEIREGRLQILEADIEALCLPDRSIAGIICVGVIEYLLNPGASLREMARVLAPGGWAVITVPNAASPFIALDRASKSIRAAGSRAYQLLRGRARDRSAYRHGYFTPWDLDRRLRAAGLEVERRAWSTFGSFMYSNSIPFSIAFSEALDSFRHRPVGVLGSNYILRAIRPASR